MYNQEGRGGVSMEQARGAKGCGRTNKQTNKQTNKRGSRTATHRRDEPTRGSESHARCCSGRYHRQYSCHKSAPYLLHRGQVLQRGVGGVALAHSEHPDVGVIVRCNGEQVRGGGGGARRRPQRRHTLYMAQVQESAGRREHGEAQLPTNQATPTSPCVIQGNVF
jgi:hypothetical protein